MPRGGGQGVRRAVWPQCWLCAVCAVGRVSCCVCGGYPVGVSIPSEERGYLRERASQRVRFGVVIISQVIVASSSAEMCRGYRGEAEEIPEGGGSQRRGWP